LLLLLIPFVHSSISCFSCASPDYRILMEKNRNIAAKFRMESFDSVCESIELRQTHSQESCQSTCLTLFEPFYFGGMEVEHRPFTVIRGCTEKILNYVDNVNRPREIDFLHEGAICVKLALSTVFPEVNEDQEVFACSCIDDNCNFHQRPSHYSSSSTSFFPLFISLPLIPIINL
ncbi:hypothetical protein PFISCL1PPCAC_20028, partial [Pristionchus fissidentatus]